MNKKSGKILLAVILAATMILPLTSNTAWADSGKATMSFGNDYFQTGQYIFFGQYNDAADEYRVMNDSGEIYSEKILDKILYRTGSQPLINKWEDSNAENWCENVFYAKALTDIEKTVVKPVTKTDSEYYYEYHDTPFIEQELKNSHAYFLSAEDIEGYYPKEADRAASMKDGSTPNYWTRSRAFGTGVLVGNIAQDCETIASYLNPPVNSKTIINIGIRHNLGARPAMTLDKSKILMITKAEGGKVSGEVGEDALRPVGDAAGNDRWILTINDTSSEFRADVTQQTSSYFTVEYSNAYTGDNGFVSVAILDEGGKIIYYGNIAKNSASGEQKVNLPSDLEEGKYTLKIFTETVNGNFRTDSGKVAVEKPLEVEKEYTITYELDGGNIDGNEGPIKETYKKGTVIEIMKAPEKEWFEFSHWEGSKYMPGDKYTVTEDHTFTAKWIEDPTETEEEYLPDQEKKESKETVKKVKKGTTKKIKAKTANSSRTGDEFNLYMWIILTLISAAGVAFGTVGNIKRGRTMHN